MDQNAENRSNVQQQLFLKYLIESMQKQQDKAMDFSTKLTEQSSGSYLSTNNLLNSNKDFLKECFQRIQNAQEHLINVNQHESTNSIPLKKRYRLNTSPSPLASDRNQSGGYSERRRKNNEAAKRSRDVRRAKEDEIALRAALLEQENVKLRLENTHLKQENVQLRCQLYSSNNS